MNTKAYEIDFLSSEDEKVNILSHDSEGKNSDDVTVNMEICEKEKAERSSHFHEHIGENYGRGKRNKKPKSFNFTQIKDQEKLSSDEQRMAFQQAWRTYRVTGKTQQLQK